MTYKRDATDRIVEQTVTEAEVVTRQGLAPSATSGAIAVSSLSVALPVSTNIGDVVVATISVGQGSNTTITTPGPTRRLLSVFATQGTGTISSGPTQGSNLWTRDTVQLTSTSGRIHQGAWEELWSDWGPSGPRSATSAASANALNPSPCTEAQDANNNYPIRLQRRR